MIIQNRARAEESNHTVTAKGLNVVDHPGERFGLLVDIISNEDAVALQSSDEEISVALDRAIDDAIDKILAERNLTPAP